MEKIHAASEYKNHIRLNIFGGIKLVANIATHILYSLIKSSAHSEELE